MTDADELMAAGRGATLCLGIPTRYMHSPCEVADGDDVEAAARLVAALARRLDGDFAAGLFLPAS
jgi:putative aminopeptidase FrvX